MMDKAKSMMGGASTGSDQTADWGKAAEHMTQFTKVSATSNLAVLLLQKCAACSDVSTRKHRSIVLSKGERV
jgi:hypothetical protein